MHVRDTLRVSEMLVLSLLPARPRSSSVTQSTFPGIQQIYPQGLQRLMDASKVGKVSITIAKSEHLLCACPFAKCFVYILSFNLHCDHQRGCYICPTFVTEETEAQREWVPCPRRTAGEELELTPGSARLHCMCYYLGPQEDLLFKGKRKVLVRHASGCLKLGSLKAPPLHENLGVTDFRRTCSWKKLQGEQK